jgi:cephalosporin-C deacetylase-like acetyl esterase
MRNRLDFSALVLVLLAGASARAEDLSIPAEKIAGGQPAKMMQKYWLDQVDLATKRWQADYAERKTPEQIAAYQRRLREKMLESIGGLPERTPLDPQVVGTIRREGYRVEKVIFQSRPKFYVTALLFLPDSARAKPPCPGVIVPCGHAMKAKGHDEYQSMGALLALSGMAALVFDPIDQGERGQYLGEGGWPKLWGTRGHSMLGVAAMLLGQNTARFEIWDGMRAIDYLQSRPEVDPNRIGCTGNSGGGTQTSYLMALDDRIKAAAVSCYLCGFPALLHTIGPQDAEQNLFGQVAVGLDHADYVMMRAPSPVLLCTATKDFFDIRGAWDVFRSSKRLYTRMGFAERVGILENDEGHNYNKTQREGVARWMARWLLGNDHPTTLRVVPDGARPITEPPLVPLSDKEILCTPDGLVMKLPGARSIYDLNEDDEKELAGRRAAAWGREVPDPVLLQQVRRVTGIRKLEDLPKPAVESLGTVERPGYRIEKLLLKPEEGIWLPALRWVPEKEAKRVVLYLHESGKAADAGPGGPIEKLVQAGDVVIAVDLRGTGQTQHARPEKPGDPPPTDTGGVNLAYLLGRSYVAARAEDVLVCARYAAGQSQAASRPGVHLMAIGNVGVPALHAAALEPGLFQSVKLVRTLSSWSDVIHNRLSRDQLVNAVHGALGHYDLPDLRESLGKKLRVTEPLDAMGRPIHASK